MDDVEFDRSSNRETPGFAYIPSRRRIIKFNEGLNDDLQPRAHDDSRTQDTSESYLQSTYSVVSHGSDDSEPVPESSKVVGSSRFLTTKPQLADVAQSYGMTVQAAERRRHGYIPARRRFYMVSEVRSLLLLCKNRVRFVVVMSVWVFMRKVC